MSLEVLLLISAVAGASGDDVEGPRSTAERSTDVVSLELMPAYGLAGPSGAPVLQVAGFGMLKVWTMYWPSFYLTAFEAAGGAPVASWGGDYSDGGGYLFYAGTEIGVPVSLGAGRTHELQLGLGVGTGIMYLGEYSDDSLALLIFAIASPTLRYRYSLDDRLAIGAGLRGFAGLGEMGLVCATIEVAWSP